MGPPTTKPDLIDDVRRLLAGGTPVDLLCLASSLVDVADPRHHLLASNWPIDPSALTELVDVVAATPGRESTALLTVLRAFVDDERRGHIEQAMSGPHELPEWLAELDRVEAGETREMVHVLGDGNNVMVELRLVGAKPVTLVVYIDHNMGSVVTEVLAVPDSLERTCELFSEVASDPHCEIQPLDRAEARARVTRGIVRGASLVPPVESDTWPAYRPLVEWVVDLLPEGGRGYERGRWTEDERRALEDAFFSSPPGHGLDDPDHRDLLEDVISFTTSYGSGDPLRWSPRVVETLLRTWAPRNIAGPPSYLTKLPNLLRGFVRYCHTERQVPSILTDKVLAIIDLLEPSYRNVGGAAPDEGPAALLITAGAYDPSSSDVDWLALDTASDVVLGQVAAKVGGMAVLDALDVDPLPDEALDLTGVAGDVVARVEAISALADACCDALFDVEVRTAVRRLLSRAARQGTEGFRQPGEAATAAAALCWLVARENDRLGQGSGQALADDVMAHFGLTGSPSAGAGALLQAAGMEDEPGQRTPVGPELLTSDWRQRLIELRDRYRRLGAFERDPMGHSEGDHEDDEDEGQGGDGDRLFALPAAGQAMAGRASLVDGPATYRLKVTIYGTKPPVWRRLEMAGETTLAELHDIIQLAFGWEDIHLHQFEIGGPRFALDDGMEWGDPAHEEATVTLTEVVGPGDHFTYTYDFGDDWEHRIVVEAVEPRSAGGLLPRCTGGRRNGPPEDVGGVAGYARLVAVVEDPDHPDRDELFDQLGGWFDPAFFNAAAITRELRSRFRA